MKLELGIEGTKEVSAALALVENLPVYLTPVMREWAGRTVNTHLWGMKNYASPRPGSDYRRTGRFGSSWGYREMGQGMFSFESSHEAAEMIVGEDQAWMHRGRWWTAEERIDEQVMQLALILEEVLRKWPKG